MTINAFIGKESEDGAVTFIYCHSDGSPSDIGGKLAMKYGSQDTIDALLQAGHIPGFSGLVKEQVHNAWCSTAGNDFNAGKPCVSVDSCTTYIELAVEHVQYAYLFADNTWRYLNACSRHPSFRLIVDQTIYGNSQRPKPVSISLKGAQIISSSSSKRCR